MILAPSVGKISKLFAINQIKAVKLRIYKKATKFEKFTTCFDIYSETSKFLEDFFQILWLSYCLNFRILLVNEDT